MNASASPNPLSAHTAPETTTPPNLPATPVRFILHFFRRYAWWYGFIVLLEIGAAVSGILAPYSLGQIVGAVTTGGPPDTLAERVTWPLGLFVALNVAELLFNRASGACRVHIAPRQRTTVARELFDYLQHHSHRYISNHFAGGLAARISETATGVNMTIWTIVFDFLPLIVTLSVSIALLWKASSGGLALFTLGWSLAFVLVSYLFARRARPYAQAHAAARSETTGRIVDAVTNLLSIRLFARAGFETSRLRDTQEQEVAVGSRALWFNEKMLWFQISAALVLKVGILVYALMLWRDGRIGVAEFVMSTSMSLVIIGEARNIGRRLLDFFEYIGNVSNGVHTIVLPHEITDRPGAGELKVERGEIELRDLHFSYSPEQPLFQGLNLTIKAGERVGLVGMSGSGKSTLVNLVMRLYDPQQGAVLIDGTDIRDVTQASLHAQISLIPQEPGLFHRSLLENIRYGRAEATEEEVYEAARQASAHDFIEKMSQRYDSLVGERGVKLSGGQRQRIAIARVIVKKAPILILDEATSSLDSLTEKVIQDGLDALMADKTVLVIAHRLSTIAHLDRVLVFDNGRIVEDGSHAELLTRDGTYRKLWSQQSQGFLPSGATPAAE